MPTARNAVGNSIPQFLVLPVITHKPHFFRDGPLGCEGDANPSV